jgi:hypothetical protein
MNGFAEKNRRLFLQAAVFFWHSPQTEGDQIRQPEGLQAGASKPPDPVGIP